MNCYNVGQIIKYCGISALTVLVFAVFYWLVFFLYGKTTNDVLGLIYGSLITITLAVIEIFKASWNWIGKQSNRDEEEKIFNILLSANKVNMETLLDSTKFPESIIKERLYDMYVKRVVEFQFDPKHRLSIILRTTR